MASSSRATTRRAAERAGRWIAAFAAIALGTSAAAEVPPPPRHVEYVYVDANEDAASGGHVALRFGPRTYHFVYADPGILRLEREDSEQFLESYAGFQNRNVEIRSIAVSEETYELLREAFNRRFLTESEAFDALDALRADRELLAGHLGPGVETRVRGAGYFLRDGVEGPSPGPAGSALARLRERVREHRGADHLAQRKLALGAALEDVGSSTAASADASGIARRHADALTEYEAVTILDAASETVPEAIVTLGQEDARLDEADRAALSGLAARLEDEAFALVGSERPDRGFPLLVALARLVALERTLHSGRLSVLDAYPDDAPRMTPNEIRARGGDLEELLAHAQRRLAAARTRFLAASPPRESDYAALEDAANRVHELRRAMDTGSAIRNDSGDLLPERAVRRRSPVAMRIEPVHAKRLLQQAEERESAQRESLEREYRYNLLARNCVSELFVEISRTLADGEATESSQTASLQRLGGYVAPNDGLSFIPFLSARAVDDAYRVDAVETIDSHRRARVRAMARDENPVVVALRESNTVTSTVYRANSADSIFLFFTDGDVASRPLLGAVNLAVGSIAAIAGVPLALVDGGSTLSRGLRGALWSLPELAFVNVRKGSFYYLPPEPTQERETLASLSASPAGSP